MPILLLAFQVISYTLKDIKDEEQYMVSLGMARTSEVVRDARIGEAEANRDAQIEVAFAEEKRLASKLSNKTEIERYKRDFEVKKAAYDTEIETSRAEAELAFKLQEAKVKQRIKEETMTTEIIERMKLIEVAEQEVLRRECELASKVNNRNINKSIRIHSIPFAFQVSKPAEAEKFRLEALAEATKKRTLLEAEANAESVGIKGDADAYAIEEKAKAESEGMAMKADAWKEYRKAAKVAMMLEAMPSIAAEVAAPLSQVNSVTMVGMVDQEGSLGPVRLTNEVLTIMDRIPDVVTNMTGHKIKNAV